MGLSIFTSNVNSYDSSTSILAVQSDSTSQIIAITKPSQISVGWFWVATVELLPLLYSIQNSKQKLIQKLFHTNKMSSNWLQANC